ncbi:MAG TPA: sugar ABC transporter ATP-binding protein [Friedmanniella sp.]
METSQQPGDGLRMRGITKEFPGTRALNGVDLHVTYGRVLSLLGENGAGKSTLMKILSGVYIPDDGEMTLDGAPYRPTGPRDAAAAGVVLIHQELSLLPNLSIAENIFVGRQPTRWGFLDRRTLKRQARAHLARVGLRIDPGTIAGTCSVAVQQQVEIAKALAQDPRVLVFDEPTASLGREEVEILYRIVAGLKADGVGIVWITHRLEEVEHVADEVMVLRDGTRVASWDHAGITTQQMIEAMVGRPIEHIYPTPRTPSDEVLLSVRDLGRPGEFEGVSFDLHQGEILGVAGLVGAGRSEMVSSLIGARPATTGTVEITGVRHTMRNPGDGVRAGMALVPEDRKGQGLAQRLTVADNIALPSRAFLRGVVDNRGLRRQVQDATQLVDLRGHLGQLAMTLSGGNQQKAVIAKWLMLDPRIVIFDEPTRGIDVGAKAAIYALIHELAAKGAGVIVVSSELPEVLGLSNRVLVLSHGRQTGILDRADADEMSVMTLAVAG